MENPWKEVKEKWRSVKLDPPDPGQWVWWGWMNEGSPTHSQVEMGRFEPLAIEWYGESGTPYECVGENIDYKDYGPYSHRLNESPPTHWLPRERPEKPTIDNIKFYGGKDE